LTFHCLQAGDRHFSAASTILETFGLGSPRDKA